MTNIGLFLFLDLDKGSLHTPFNRAIGLMGRVSANGPEDLGSIRGRVIPKTQKMILAASLLNTQHYKVRVKGEVEQSWEWSSAFSNTSV